MDKSAFSQWRSHPVTQLFFFDIEALCFDEMQRIDALNTETANYQGIRLATLNRLKDELLDWKSYEEGEDKEEDNE